MFRALLDTMLGMKFEFYWPLNLNRAFEKSFLSTVWYPYL